MNISHLGIIPDGNRRWAKLNGESIDCAYHKFSKNIVKIISSCNDFEIKELSIYLISKENLKRDFSDVFSVLKAIKDMLTELNFIAKNSNLRITVEGIENVDDRELIILANNLINETVNNTACKINLLIGYNPFDEIQLALKEGKIISIENLSINRYVDLIIRTAGTPVRLSNFLPLQSGYANIEVLNKYFNDLTVQDILSVVERYKFYSPNYGK